MVVLLVAPMADWKAVWMAHCWAAKTVVPWAVKRALQLVASTADYLVEQSAAKSDPQTAEWRVEHLAAHSAEQLVD